MLNIDVMEWEVERVIVSTSKDLVLLSSLLDEIKRTADELTKARGHYPSVIEMSVMNAEESVTEKGTDDAVKSDVKKKQGYSFGFLFLCAALSAPVFAFGAETAIQRDPFGNVKACIYIVAAAAVVTNFFFNLDAYTDFVEDDQKLTVLQRLIAVVASFAVMAPYFFLGFDGALWQKILVAISTVFNLPVFYYGALDFYKFFNVDFIQLWCAILCLSTENFLLALQKSFMLLAFKQQFNEFVYGSKEDRKQFIDDYMACSEDERLQFLINRNKTVDQDNSLKGLLTHMFCTRSGMLDLVRWLLSSGTCIFFWGAAALAQNLGHFAMLVCGIMALPMPMPFWAKALLSAVVLIFNVIPNLGYSFSTMARFDFINFIGSVCFIYAPQRQRVLMNNSTCALILVCATLFLLRCVYMISGFANDEINYEGALFLGANEESATLAGISANIAGAIIFNGVLNESLFKKQIGKCVQKSGDQEDKEQVAFEDLYEKAFSKFMVLPLKEIEKMSGTSGFKLIYANYFQIPKVVTTSVTKNPITTPSTF